MTNRNVLEAWELLNRETNLKRFNFLPSVITTLYLGVIVLYQAAFTYVSIFGGSHEFFRFVVDIAEGKYLIPLAIAIISGVIVYIVAVPIGQAGLLALIDKDIRLARGELPAATEGRTEHFYSYAISRGIVKFFPIFELNNLTTPFNMLAIATFTLLLVRVAGHDYVGIVCAVMFGYFLVSVVINTLFAYARYFVVFEDKPPFEAVAASISMTFDNLSETFGLYFTILLLYLRTFFTAALFIIFPALVFGALSYVTIDHLRLIGTILFGIVFVLFIGVISHLNSVLEIFTQTVWYVTYRENKAEKARQSGE